MRAYVCVRAYRMEEARNVRRVAAQGALPNCDGFHFPSEALRSSAAIKHPRRVICETYLHLIELSRKPKLIDFLRIITVGSGESPRPRERERKSRM
jgi:hypothetical protein